MSFVSSWRTALRIARREARRSKGRSALVAAMIALPVLALGFAAATYDMLTLTGAERADRTMGSADARIVWNTGSPIRQMPDPDDGWESGATADEPPGTAADLLGSLPAGSTVLPVRRGTVAVETPVGLGQPDAVAVDATSPLVRGYVDVLAGRAPESASEVALTEHAMAWLDVGLGGTVTVYETDGDAERQYTVVGRVEFPSLLDSVLLFAPAPDDAAVSRWFSQRDASWFVDTPEPIDWPQVQKLNRLGMLVTARAVLIDPPPDDEVPLRQAWGDQGAVNTDELAASVLVFGLALLEVVLLAGPAFAVGARRRSRQLALVAANGGTPAHVRRIVLADGVVLGVLGAAVGLAVGVAGAFVARPWVEEYLDHRLGGYRVFPEALAGLAAMAVLTGLAAALVPAFTTARQAVVAALAGRRGVTRSRKRWITVGIVMIGLGALVTVAGALRTDATIMLAGLIVAELGLVLCTPALVGLVARIGGLLPLAPRIALRDAARNRAAAAPAISAVMAAVAGSVLLGMVIVSQEEHSRSTWSQDVPTGTVSVYLWRGELDKSPQVVTDAIRSTLPVDTVHPVGRASCASEDPSAYCDIQVALNDRCPQLSRLLFGELTDADREAAAADPDCDPRFLSAASSAVVDDGTALATLTGASGDDLARARDTLARGGVVVRSPAQIDDGMVTIAVVVPDPDATQPSSGPPTMVAPGIAIGHDQRASLMTVPGYLLTTAIGPGSAIVPPDLVQRTGLTVRTSQLVATPTREPTDEDRERFAAAMRGLDAAGSIVNGWSSRLDPVLWLLTGAAALITIGAAAIGTGLAAADGRADLSTLAAVGASPTMRRGLSVSQSGVIAGLGSALGSLAGIGAAYAVIEASNREAWVRLWPSTPTQPVLPWLVLAAVLVAVPLIAILGAGLLTRARLPIERRL